MAHVLGWRVTVADNRPAFARSELFPQADVRLVSYDDLGPSGLRIDDATAVMIMTHHFLHDLELLAFLLPATPPYVGLLGPRKRRENLLEELARRGTPATPTQLACLYGPAGLDIGSETSPEIALAVLAEIQAVLARRAGVGFLRDRPGSLHEPAP
jgi:xanthine/CO dehydrogenase XdhC/CoxF family maturation factor